MGERHLILRKALRLTRTFHAMFKPATKYGLSRLRVFALSVAMSILGSSLPLQADASGADEEQQLIRVLQSGRSSAQEKDAACARLKRIGTTQSIPALSALLGDEELSHSARYALESMPGPEAGGALLGALEKTSGLTKVGIINSLGLRREPRAASGLARLLADADPAVESAAARALGRIGGPKALSALQATLAGSKAPAEPVRQAVDDAVLRCANRLLASGDAAKAKRIFQRLCEKEKKESVRVAAYRGLILSSGKGAVRLMCVAIAGDAGPGQTAALELAHEFGLPGLTKALVELLPKVGSTAQVALIEALAQRGDASAAPAIARLAGNASTAHAVRLAAIQALGLIGEASVAPVLVQAAASGAEDERGAARQSLVELRRGPVTDALLGQLASAEPAVQAAAARALGERGDMSAWPGLLELARRGSDSARKAGLQALALLAGQPQLASMVQLVIDAQAESTRAQAAEALNAACRHIQSRHGRLDVTPLVEGLAAGPAEARMALLPVCGGLNDPRVRTALRSAIADSNASVRNAGLRALCDTMDGGLLPDLVKAACEAPEENLRALAISACVRLATQEETVKLSNSQRMAVFKPILGTALRVEQKRLLLSGLAEVSDLEALIAVEPLLADDAVQTEAAQAAIKIAGALPPAQAAEAADALGKVLAKSTDAASRAAAEAALKKIQAEADFITDWQVAGPYVQEGKDCAALFDIAFPPELAGAQGVSWRSLPAGADPRRPWLMDLLKTLGGEQRVAYARTWIRSETEQPARLELGTDDGVKVWLNGNLVHANNVIRGLKPGSDKVNVTLNSGWNLLLLKVTQFNQGWEFCARLLKPDGSHLDGLQFDAGREKN